MFSDPASHRKTATPHGSVPINRADFVVSMSIPGTGRDAIVSRSHDADSAGGQDRAAREEYRARVLAEVREDLSNRGVDLSVSKQSEKWQVERDTEVESQPVVKDMNFTTQSEMDLDHTVSVENDSDDVNSADATNEQDSTEATETAESSWDDWDMDDNEFDDVFGDDDELADSDDIPEDLDDILGDDLDDIPDDL